MDDMEERVVLLEASLRALHKRNDGQDRKLEFIEKNMLTAETMEDLLTAQFNSRLVKGVWTVVKIGLGIGVTALTAWVVHLFGFKE